MSVTWERHEGHEDWCAVNFGCGKCDCAPEPLALRVAYRVMVAMFLIWYCLLLYKVGAWIFS